MSITVQEYIDVRQRAAELGLTDPGDGVYFLPLNYQTAGSKEELKYEGSLPDVRRLLKELGLVVAQLDGNKPVLKEQKAHEWLLPTLVVLVSSGGVAYKIRPEQVKAIVAKLYEQAKLVFTAVSGRTRIKWDVVIEKSKAKTTKKVSFDGPAEEFEKIVPFLEKAIEASEKDEA